MDFSFRSADTQEIRKLHRGPRGTPRAAAQLLRHAMKILPLSTDSRPTEIEQIAQRRLRESPYFFLKRLNCHFDDGVLTLRGCVPFGQLKQFAEAIVGRIDGVQEVANHVEIFDAARGQLTAPAARSAG